MYVTQNVCKIVSYTKDVLMNFLNKNIINPCSLYCLICVCANAHMPGNFAVHIHQYFMSL
jgi:hypothetical protein